MNIKSGCFNVVTHSRGILWAHKIFHQVKIHSNQGVVKTEKCKKLKNVAKTSLNTVVPSYCNIAMVTT